MPAFRAAKIIDATIESVVAQTYGDWELLIADDCSPDNTREVVRAWSEKDSRIRLLELAQNGGPAAARNAGLAQAKGRWLAFLDSDDLWLPAKLERQLAFHRASGAKLTFTGFRRISSDASTMGRYIDVPEKMNYRQLLANTAIATSTVVVDQKATGPIRMTKTYYDDFACWLGILKSGGEARGLREDLMRYRVLSASVSRNKRNSAKQVWLAYRRIEKLGLIASVYFFSLYGVRGLLKYRRF
jgi:teichuronic acid biosynthesis glycosyltransferase TuaG